MAKLKNLKNYWTLLPFLIVLLLIEIVPLFNIIFKSFFDPEGNATLANYVEIFTKPIYLKTVSNSLYLPFLSSLGGLIIAFCSGLAISASSAKTQNTFMSILNMTSNFCGVPLAFAFMIILGNSGVLVLLAQKLGLGIFNNFNLYSINGIALVYLYFQIPLGTLMIIPAFNGIRKEWKESAALLHASSFTFWMRVGVPVLVPSIVNTFCMLFANALAAYATIYALVTNNFPVLPTKVAEMFTGEVVQRAEFGSALTVVMLVMMIVVIALGNLVKKLCARGETA